MKSFSTQHGLSLIELLISMALGAVLLVGLINLYSNNKKTYQLTQEMARLQENGRIASQIMSRDIRMTSYVGCGRLEDIDLNVRDFDKRNSLAGWHNGRSSTVMKLPVLTKELKANTDAVLIQAADANTVPVKSTTAHMIYYLQKHDFAQDELLLISDCQQADMLYLNNIKLQHKYQIGSQISRWGKIIYYIAKTTRKDKTGKPVYALYRRDLNGAAGHSELIDSVEDMQIYFGETTPKGYAINYVNAEQVKDWQAVRSIKINLLLVSKVAVNDALQRYEFNGKSYQANDHRLYMPWQMVIALRERIG